jgi:hypothetical protein
MSKRFPIPPFDHEQLKNLDWQPPTYLGDAEQGRMVESVQSGKADWHGAYPVKAHPAFYDRFKLRGPHQHAVLCVLPNRNVTMIGRSHAWAIQQALIVDSLEADRAKVLHDWRTPRPMNTRLGPDNGVTVSGGVLYVICSHRYADYWLVNRTLCADKGFADSSGFGVISASDDQLNDFHACNVWFSW